jgi:phage tail-like protein
MNANPYSRFLLRVRGPLVNVDYPLLWGYTSIGRSSESSLPIDDPKFAANGQLHIGCTAQGGWLLDRNSRSGVLRNGEPLAQDVAAPLVVGDIYTLGDHSLEVVSYPPPPEAAPPVASQEAQPDAAQGDERRSAEPLPPKPLAPKPPPDPAPPAARPGVVRKPRSPVPEPQLHLLEEVLPRESVRFVHYLPELYSRREADPSASNPCAPGFMARFLGLFESLYLPVEWTVANFDLRLHLRTAPAESLSWWERWFDLDAGDSWSTQQRRDLLANAFDLFGRRGTRSALAQALELFTGYTPEIQDQGADLPLHTFRVRVYLDAETDPAPIAGLIDLFKPAHTTYELTCVALMPADAVVSAADARESNEKAK